MKKNCKKMISLVLAGLLLCSTLIPLDMKVSRVAAQTITENSTENVLKAFVFADSHVGQSTAGQPTIAQQKLLVSNVMSEIPDLDAFIDVGDIFSKDSNSQFQPEAIKDTVDIFTNGSKNIPYFFSSGNHELQSVDSNHTNQYELLSKTYGTPNYPWYSFNLKNIHFVALPEAGGHVSYVDPELLEWLKFDLKLNAGKTTIVLSHNAIKGTTDPLVPDNNPTDLYRLMYNSEQIVQILKDYNVAAWVHGHNHSFDIVNKDGIAYVSAGRSGGFSFTPYVSLGTGYLGGTYIEITSNKIIFKGYDGLQKQFLVDINDPVLLKSHMATEIAGQTSLDISKSSELSYGALSRDGMKAPFYNSFYGENTTAQLSVGSTGLTSIIADPNLANFGNNSNGGADIPGISVMENGKFALGNLGPSGASWLNPGMSLPASSTGYQITMFTGPGANCLYKVVPGEKLKFTLKTQSTQSLGTVEIKYGFYNKDVYQMGSTVSAGVKSFQSGANTLEWTIDVPSTFSEDTIFNDLLSDNTVNIKATMTITNPQTSLTVSKLDVTTVSTDADTVTKDVAVKYEGNTYSANGILGNTISTFNIPVPTSRETLEFSAKGNKTFVWAVTIKGIETQVKNGIVSKDTNGLRLEGIRNPYNRDNAVFFAQIDKTEKTFTEELTGINKALVKKYDSTNRALEVYVDEFSTDFSGTKTIVVNSPLQIENVYGATIAGTSGTRTTLNVTNTGNVIVLFKAGNPAVLSSLITTCQSLQSTTYTTGSWTAFSQALNIANVVLNNSDATQSEIDAVAQVLQNAKDKLVLLPQGQQFSIKPSILFSQSATPFQATVEIEENPTAQYTGTLVTDGNVTGWKCLIGNTKANVWVNRTNLTLAPGKYQAAVVMKLLSEPNPSSLRISRFTFVDASVAPYTFPAKEIYRTDFSALNTYTTIPFTFTQATQTSSISLRAYFDNNASWILDKFIVTKLADTITLDKTSASMTVGDTMTLLPTVSPAETYNTNVIWSSNNNTVASVNASTGQITANSAGTATITATAADGGGATSSCIITVSNPVVINSDKTALNALISTCTSFVQSQYSPETWSPFSTALSNAQAVSASSYVTQEQVDSAKATLQTTKNNLVWQITIQAEENLSPPTGSIVTDGNVTGVQCLIGNLKSNVFVNKTATFSPGDYRADIVMKLLSEPNPTTLRIANFNFADMTNGNNQYLPIYRTHFQATNTYTTIPYSFTQVGTASTISVRLYFDNNASWIVDKVIFTKIPATKTSLNTLIAQCDALNANLYTADSWSNMQLKLTSAKTISAYENASQKEVDDAKTALEKYYVRLVKIYPDVSEILADEPVLRMVVGETTTATVTVLPINALNKNVTWSIGDSTIAEYNNGTVLAKKVGTTVLTATTQDGNKTAICAVLVSEAKPTVNKLTLNSLLLQCGQVDGNLYTTGSYNPFETIYQLGNLVSNSNLFSQANINSIITALTDTYNTLIMISPVIASYINSTVVINRTTLNISNVAPQTNINDLQNRLKSNGGVFRFKNNSGQTITDGFAGTGTKIQLLNNQGTIVDELSLIIYGDVDGDGQIYVADMANIKQHLLKSNELTGDFKKAADISKKGTVTISDLISIKKKLLGLAEIIQ